MAAYTVDTLQSPGSLKAFKIVVTTPSTANAKAIVEDLSPLMYWVKSDGGEIHAIVDGHAFDETRVDLIADAITPCVITTGDQITVAS